MLRPAGPNVFTVVGAPATWQQRLVVATSAARRVVVSHQAAARQHGLEQWINFDTVVVTVDRGSRVRVPGIVTHQVGVPIPASDIIRIDGIATTSLARTIVDLGSVIEASALVRACDEFERRGASVRWLQHVARRLNRPGQRGPRAVLDHLDVRAEQGRVSGSWFERLMAECLSSTVLPELIPQYVICDDDGGFLAQVDLGLPSVKLAIEMHSRAFHSGTHREVVDQRRENRSMLLGWQFLYLGWADRKTPAEARQYLEQLYLRRLGDLGAA